MIHSFLHLGAALLGICMSFLALNSWVPFNSTFDYVVVGGGTAGITIGARLAQHGSRVAIVEAGGFYELQHPVAKVPGAAIIGIGSNPKTASPIDWRFVVSGASGTDYRDIHYPRGKCLGGSPSQEAMMKWAELVDDPSYTLENSFPFFKQTIQFTPPGPQDRVIMTFYNESSFSPTGGPLHLSYPKYAMQFSSWAQQAFKEAGIPEVVDFNSGSLIGHQFCPMTIRPRDQTRSTSESAFIGAFPYMQNLTVYQKTMATRILFDEENRAVGVTVKHKWSYTLTATKEVILSAGAFQSPQLLMVSGVGPAEILQKHGIKLIANRSGVGQNMWDHIFFGPSYPVTINTYTKLAQSTNHLVTQIWNWFVCKKGMLSNPSTDYLAFEKIPSQYRSTFTAQEEQDLSWFPPDWPETEYLVASAYVGNFSNPFWQQPITGQYASIVASIVAPTSRGNVSIRSANMADPPIINPNWLGTETDRKMAIAAYKRIREFFDTKALVSVLAGPEYFPGRSIQSDDEILFVIKQTMMTIYHASCTCKMGIENDSMAVVDSHARVFGVSRLRVVDASAFPILPPGHPQSTVYMLAEKIAADIISS
ncbi:Dehydrogenase patE [Penicillium malachiteum]|uniref:Dehydrogenase patE n=1 Tax=Penicillium malachiteum TaxID=1324776 RepID=A0AAD6HQQ6_9EURO|nr:Dehydrogenase patE [Penicillium malachiteum]